MKKKEQGRKEKIEKLMLDRKIPRDVAVEIVEIDELIEKLDKSLNIKSIRKNVTEILRRIVHGKIL